jgi:hypothetical protein
MFWLKLGLDGLTYVKRRLIDVIVKRVDQMKDSKVAKCRGRPKL